MGVPPAGFSNRLPSKQRAGRPRSRGFRLPRGRRNAPAFLFAPERAEECDQLVLLSVTQRVICVDDRGRLSSRMTLNGLARH